MPGLSDYMELNILRYLTKTNKDAQGTPATALPTTPPASLYISLHSGDPSDTGANELVSGSSPGYARVTVNADADDKSGSATAWEPVTTSGTGKRVSNKADIAFPQATGNWNGSSAITYLGIWDALTSGNFIGGGQIGGGTGVVVLQNNTLKFAGYGAGSPPGAVVISID